MAIDKSLIHQPQVWQLVVEVTPGDLRCMAFCPLEERSLMTQTVVPENTDDPVKDIENAIYDTPGLLLDYGRVTVLWRTERFVPMPGFVSDPDVAREIFNREYSGDTPPNGAEFLHDSWPGMAIRLECAVDRSLAAFMRRTFNNPRMLHALTPPALWFAPAPGRRGPGKILANLTATDMDIYVMGDDAPLLINSYFCPDINDALYYVLAVREALGITPDKEMLLAGDSARRVRLSQELRRFVRYVMPAIFPAEMFRAGREVLSAPFEVAIAPVVATGPSL